MLRSTRRRRPAVADPGGRRRLSAGWPLPVALAASALWPASCSSDPSAREAIDGALERAVGGGASNVNVLVTADNVPNATVVKGDGVVDHARGVAALDMTLPPVAGTDLGQDVVFADGTTYVLLPRFLAKGLGGKAWAGIQLDSTSGLDGTDLLSFLQMHLADPSASLVLLQGIYGQVVEVGSETVGGREATRYRVKLKPREAVVATTGPPRMAVQRLADLHHRDIAAEVVVDRAGELRRLQYNVNLSDLDLPADAASLPTDGIISVELELDNAGGGLSHDVPSDGDVLDLVSTMRRRGKAFAFAHAVNVQAEDLGAAWEVRVWEPFTTYTSENRGPCAGRRQWSRDLAGTEHNFSLTPAAGSGIDGYLQATASVLPTPEEAARQFSFISSAAYVPCEEQAVADYCRVSEPSPRGSTTPGWPSRTLTSS